MFAHYAGNPTEDELDLYLEATRQSYESRTPEPCVLVVSLSAVWPARFRKKVRAFELRCEREYGVQRLGIAMVAERPLIRAAFRAYTWLAPMKHPAVMVPNAADAYDFVAACLGDHALPVPDESEFRRVACSTWPGHEFLCEADCISVRAAS